MKKENTIKQNVEWLLEQYKKELEEAKNDNKQDNDCEYGYNKDQFINDAENIVIELQYLLDLAK